MGPRRDVVGALVFALALGACSSSSLGDSTATSLDRASTTAPESAAVTLVSSPDPTSPDPTGPDPTSADSESVDDTAPSSTESVTSTASTNTTAAAVTTSTVTTSTVTTSTTTAGAGAVHFGTLPPGSALPTDEECAALVRPAPELRPDNEPFNNTLGDGPQQTEDQFLARVTGHFTGTTDEIIQWAACKWGIDEDVVRAQAAKETGWFMSYKGDLTSDPSSCVPGHEIGVDGFAGQCPESVGIMQTRYQYMKASFPMARDSTAYNLDVALALRRRCFEGVDTWLNTADRGQDYAAGDLWGCIGTWFAGRWYTDAANGYITAVKEYLDQRIWTTADFAGWHSN